MVEYGYEFSFLKRLRLILKNLKDYLGDESHLVDRILVDPKKFVLEVKDTRDLLTHHMRELPENAIDISDLDLLREYTWKMQMLLRICLLREMDISADKVRVLLAKNDDYKNLVWVVKDKMIRDRQYQHPFFKLPQL